MRRAVILGGAGAMGRIIARDMKQAGVVEPVIADRDFADAQCSGQITLKQEWRSRQGARDIVESEISAVARQKRRNVYFHTQKIANRVGVFRAVETMQDITARIVLPGRGAIEMGYQGRSEAIQLGCSGRR